MEGGGWGGGRQEMDVGGVEGGGGVEDTAFYVTSYLQSNTGYTACICVHI